MIIQVTDLLHGLNRIAPFKLAESWDNVGLLIGDPRREVHSLLLGLDPTLSLLDEAINAGIDTIITHHPCIFRPFPSVNIATPDGVFLERALTYKINVIACHTNFDSAATGVSDALGALLGLEKLQPLLPAGNTPEANTGLGRIGHYPQSLPFSRFMVRVFQVLDTEIIQLAGIKPSQIKKVALCGGSGSNLAEGAYNEGADIYLSSEIKHSTAIWAEEAGFCILNGTHYSTEKPAMALLGRELAKLGEELDWNVKIHKTTTERTPFTNMMAS